MKKHIKLLTSLVFLTVGCSANVPNTASTGAIGIAVEWPQKSGLSVKTIPVDSVKIRISITGDGLTDKPIEEFLNYPESKLRLKNIPIGNKKISVEALDTSSKILATGDRDAIVKTSEVTIVEVALAPVTVPTPIPATPMPVVIPEPLITPTMPKETSSIIPPTSPPPTITLPPITPPPTPVVTASPIYSIVIMPSNLNLYQNNGGSLRVFLKDSNGTNIVRDDMKIEIIDPDKDKAKILAVTQTSTDYIVDIQAVSSGTATIKATYSGYTESSDVSIMNPPEPPKIATSKIAFKDQSLLSLSIMDANGQNRKLINTSNSGDDYPDISPDGTKIAFLRSDNNIYLANIDGSNVTQLTSAGQDSDPKWSPDGTKIAFSRTGYIVMIPSAGGAIQQVTNGGSDTFPAWSPDGSKIAFNRSGKICIGMADTNLTAPTQITTDSTNSAPSWSPSGNKIAYEKSSGTYDIYVQPPDSVSAAVNITNTGAINEQYPTWSPDGTKIAFVYDAGTADIYVMNADGSGKTNITNTPSVVEMSPNWSHISW